ncbi:hypothetical protein EON67_09545, partial [archaeon]
MHLRFASRARLLPRNEHATRRATTSSLKQTTLTLRALVISCCATTKLASHGRAARSANPTPASLPFHTATQQLECALRCAPSSRLGWWCGSWHTGALRCLRELHTARRRPSLLTTLLAALLAMTMLNTLALVRGWTRVFVPCTPLVGANMAATTAIPTTLARALAFALNVTLTPRRTTAIAIPQRRLTVFAGLRATCESVGLTGHAKAFDVFVLSDSY